MVKASLWLKIAVCSFLCAVFILGIFGFNDDSKIKDTIVKNIDAAGMSCKGPADVILVIDRSASMVNFNRFNIAKTASVNFIDKLFTALPDDIYYGDNAYHQVGLVAFHNLIDNEALNKSGDYIKGVINNNEETGILRNSYYPVGYRRASLAISTAKDSLNPDLSSTNPSATKTMIVITDGPPYYDPDDAIAFADSAKSAGVRIISVGLKLDSISDEIGRTAAEETAAEDFIRNIASAPFDCYYASDSGAVLAGCNSVSADNLADALDGVYTSITDAICDEDSPTISISREPSGTLYNVDNLIITSTAKDDVGFKEHTIRWSDNWSNPETIRNIECGDLVGTTTASGVVIECNTGGIGSFSSGTNISYRSSVTDANENEATIEEPNPRNVTVADVTLTIPELLRNTNKTIKAVISNYGGNDDIFISIDAPVLAGIEIDKAPMSCSSSGSTRTCTYVFNTKNFGDGCLDWTDGITGGFANNINVNIYFYAQSSDVGIRQIASSENNLLVSGCEGIGCEEIGTCTDTLNNDCDYDISNDPIIDAEEELCDTAVPVVGISRDPAGDVYDLESDGVTPMAVTLTSVAGDDITYNNGIKRNTIYYKIDGGSLQVAFDCNDANADSLCDEDTGKNVNSISAIIGPFNAGENVEYYSTAIDYSGNDNTTNTATESFIVKNRECEGVGNLGDCLVTENAKCCNGICNASISNPNSYNIVHCAEEICDGISWEWGPANDTVICSESGEPTECHSFSALYGLPPGDPPYFYDGGCEERAYRCSSGYCDYGSAIIKGDYCIGGGSLILNDYECSGTSCVLNPDPAVENDICDLELDSLSVNTYNSDDPIVLISGSSGVTDGEVLDNLTNKVSLRSSTGDINGISEQKIYWKKNTDTNFSVKDCDVSSCGISPDSCNCTEDIGPFNIGDIVEFYASSKDDSPNKTEEVEGSSSGLRYCYYDGNSFNTYKGSDVDTNVSHYWSSSWVTINGNSWEDQYDTVSIIWDGTVSPDVMGEYTFYVKTDDGIRLYLDGNLVIDKWFLQGTTEYSTTYNFTSLESIPIRVEWYENGGGATMQLGWKPPSGSKAYPIPAGNLTAPYSFTVRDNQCYDVPGGAKLNLTLCDFDGGRCCGGICDSSRTESSIYDDECTVDACSGESWIEDKIDEFGFSKDTDSCGSTDSCFDYYSPNVDFYSGCITGGNECSSGQCNTLSTLTSYPTCNINSLTSYDCDNYETGSCQERIGGTDIDCSVVGDYDNDSSSGGTDCNCDCNNYDIEEKVYSSLSFDGEGDYVIVNPISDFPTTEITVAFWIKSLDTSKYGTPVSYATSSNTNEFVVYDYRGFKPHIKGSSVSTGISANDGNWHHIVVTWRSSDGKIKLYKNGDSEIYSGTLQTGATLTQGGSLIMGQEQDSVGGGFQLNQAFLGFMDDVRIYNRALYPEEILNHYNGMFVDDTGLVGHWDFDPINAEEANGIAGDRSGKGNDGSLSNVDGVLYGNPKWEAGKYGNGIDLDGDDYVNIPSDLGDPSAMSLDFWFYVSESDKTRIQYFMDGRNGGNWWFLQSYNPNGTGNINFNNYVKVDSSGWDAGQWNHLILATNSSSSKIYINGDLKSTGSGFNPDIGKIRIGKYNYSDSYYFKGKFDEVRVYNRALSEIEVAEHHKGVFSDNSGLIGYWDFNESSGTIAEDSSGNGPEWVKYGNGDDKDEDGNVIDILNRNVPAPWQVCTDGKNNDCDEVADDYDDITGISNCDGEVDGVFVTATAMNRTCVTDVTCIEGSDLFSVGNVITVDDIDIERAENDFIISSYGTNDKFLIKETMIEWTTDNWANKNSKTCDGIGAEMCEVCVEGGSCGEDNDDILSSSLSAGNTFSFRICAWDESINNNHKCTDYYNIIIENSNSAPEVTNLSIRDHNFCTDGLEYVLEWVFSDLDGDTQESYEIQVKEGDNDFSTGLIVDVKKTLPSSYYQILSGDFVIGEEIEYGEGKNYYWRLKVTDSRGGGYERTSEWVEYNDLSDSDGDGNSATFTTPIYKYPQVDFSAISDSGNDCLYETGYEHVGTEVRCDFGEDIIFSDESIYVECDGSNDKQCIRLDAVNCDISEGRCTPCLIDNDCFKFNSEGVSYSCVDGICEASGSCASDDDCKVADIARCEIDSETGIGICVSCDDDSQCSNEKFGTTGIDYFCNNLGECDNKDFREWYFYGSDIGDPGSINPNPINNYIESESKTYNVIFKVKDIIGNSCYEIKKILLGGRDYPKWNESSVRSN